MKLHLGHGGHILDGWMNLEQHQCDITKPLAFKNDSVDFIFCEHVLEHVTPQQGYRFLKEAHRILKPQGVIRVIVPDVCKVEEEINDSYRSLVKEGMQTWWPFSSLGPPPQNPTDKDIIETLIFCHGHQAIYNEELLLTVMRTAGFKAEPRLYQNSGHEELNNIDSHWKYMGLENCILESCVVEGTKP